MAWEESEEFQRVQLRIILFVLALFCGGWIVASAWNDDWGGILLLASGIGAILVGFAVWASLMAILIHGGLRVARLWRTRRGNA